MVIGSLTSRSQGRYYNGRPIIAEFSPVTDFREATCRQVGVPEPCFSLPLRTRHVLTVWRVARPGMHIHPKFCSLPLTSLFTASPLIHLAPSQQYEENTCNRGGYCNFMHLKPIGKDLRKRLFGRYKRSDRSRSRSRDRWVGWQAASGAVISRQAGRTAEFAVARIALSLVTQRPGACVFYTAVGLCMYRSTVSRIRCKACMMQAGVGSSWPEHIVHEAQGGVATAPALSKFSRRPNNYRCCALAVFAPLLPCLCVSVYVCVCVCVRVRACRPPQTFA